MREGGEETASVGDGRKAALSPPPRWNPTLRSGLCPYRYGRSPRRRQEHHACHAARCTAMRRVRLAGASFPARAHMGEREGHGPRLGGHGRHGRGRVPGPCGSLCSPVHGELWQRKIFVAHNPLFYMTNFFSSAFLCPSRVMPGLYLGKHGEHAKQHDRHRVGQAIMRREHLAIPRKEVL